MELTCQGSQYLSSFIMPGEPAEDSVVGGKVLHKDGGDFGKVSRTSGSCRRVRTQTLSHMDVTSHVGATATPR